MIKSMMLLFQGLRMIPPGCIEWYDHVMCENYVWIKQISNGLCLHVLDEKVKSPLGLFFKEQMTFVKCVVTMKRTLKLDTVTEIVSLEPESQLGEECNARDWLFLGSI